MVSSFQSSGTQRARRQTSFSWLRSSSEANRSEERVDLALVLERFPNPNKCHVLGQSGDKGELLQQACKTWSPRWSKTAHESWQATPYARTCVALAGSATQSAQTPAVVTPVLSNTSSRGKSLTRSAFQVGQSIKRLKIDVRSSLQPDCPVMSNVTLVQFRRLGLQRAAR